MDSLTPDLRDVDHTIAARVVERVKARRIGVNALVFVLGLVVGLCASRTPVGLTSKLLACPYHYDRLDTKFTLELLAKDAQLNALVADNERLVADNERLELALNLERLELALNLERLEALQRLEFERAANATGTHFMWEFNDMLWI